LPVAVLIVPVCPLSIVIARSNPAIAALNVNVEVPAKVTVPEPTFPAEVMRSVPAPIDVPPE
jgi:hypothetical protein